MELRDIKELLSRETRFTRELIEGEGGKDFLVRCEGMAPKSVQLLCL